MDHRISCLQTRRWVSSKIRTDLSPSFHPHSSLSILFARCQLGVSRFSGCCNLNVALLDSALADQEPAQIPQSPELGDLVNLHPFYQHGFGLRCASNQWATVAKRVVSLADHPKLV